MPSLRLLVCCLAAALLLISPTASAGTPADAQRFGAAVAKARVAVVALRPEFARRSQDLETRCAPALEGVPRGVARQAGAVLGVAIVQALFEPALPALRQVVADLDAVPTRDRALRSGRAAWRAALAAVERFPRLEDPCGMLERWRAAGWSQDAAPPLDFAALERAVDEEDSSSTVEAKLRRAARRLRALGVSRRRAQLFRGSALLAGLVDDSLGESSSQAGRRR